MLSSKKKLKGIQCLIFLTTFCDGGETMTTFFSFTNFKQVVLIA